MNKILSSISGEYFKNYEINKVIRENNLVKVYYGSENEFFTYDKVVLASHADETVNIISDLNSQEREVLSNFKYRKNKMINYNEAKKILIRSKIKIEDELVDSSNSINRGFPVGISKSFILRLEMLNKYLHNALSEFP